jgi:hypothetical protein
MNLPQPVCGHGMDTCHTHRCFVFTDEADRVIKELDYQRWRRNKRIQQAQQEIADAYNDYHDAADKITGRKAA